MRSGIPYPARFMAAPMASTTHSTTCRMNHAVSICGPSAPPPLVSDMNTIARSNQSTRPTPPHCRWLSTLLLLCPSQRQSSYTHAAAALSPPAAVDLSLGMNRAVEPHRQRPYQVRVLCLRARGWRRRWWLGMNYGTMDESRHETPRRAKKETSR